MAKKTRSKGRRYLALTLFAVLLVLLVLVIGGWMYLYNQYLYPERHVSNLNPSEFGLEFESVTLKANDEILLHGWLIKPPLPMRSDKMPTIIALHGYNTNRGDILPRTAELAKAGFQVFTYDHRACGDSEGEKITMGAKELIDLKDTIIPYVMSLESVDQTKVGIYGFSMGAVISIAAAAQTEVFSAIVADSPYASLHLITQKILSEKSFPSWPYVDLLYWNFKQDFGVDMKTVDALTNAPHISPMPFLLIHGEKDDTVPFSHAEMIVDVAREPKRLLRLPGNDHTDNGTVEIMNGEVIPFFKKALAVTAEPERMEKSEEEITTEENEETSENA